MNILIGEDDNDIILMYLELLKNRGHSVTTVNDGEACLATYSEKLSHSSRIEKSGDNLLFDTVVLDYKMPKIDGFEVARRIYSLNPNQRIILASAYSKEIFEDAAEYFNLPIEILQKPFSGSKFLKTVENEKILSESLA